MPSISLRCPFSCYKYWSFVTSWVCWNQIKTTFWSWHLHFPAIFVWNSSSVSELSPYPVITCPEVILSQSFRFWSSSFSDQDPSFRTPNVPVIIAMGFSHDSAGSNKLVFRTTLMQLEKKKNFGFVSSSMELYFKATQSTHCRHLATSLQNWLFCDEALLPGSFGALKTIFWVFGRQILWVFEPLLTTR